MISFKISSSNFDIISLKSQRISEGSMDKQKIKEYASAMPSIRENNEADLSELLNQMNKHNIAQMNISSQ